VYRSYTDKSFKNCAWITSQADAGSPIHSQEVFSILSRVHWKRAAAQKRGKRKIN
jgi:hypothetical protein